MGIEPSKNFSRFLQLDDPRSGKTSLVALIGDAVGSVASSQHAVLKSLRQSRRAR
jgi:hypothetical protein